MLAVLGGLGKLMRRADDVVPGVTRTLSHESDVLSGTKRAMHIDNSYRFPVELPKIQAPDRIGSEKRFEPMELATKGLDVTQKSLEATQPQDNQVRPPKRIRRGTISDAP